MSSKEKESVNLNREQRKLSRLRNKQKEIKTEENQTESKGAVGHATKGPTYTRWES